MILLLKLVTVLFLTTFITCLNVSLTMPHKCQVDLTAECALDSLKQIQNRRAQKLPKTVENYLNQVMSITINVRNNVRDENGLISYGNGVLDVTENLVSGLVRKRGSKESISISLQYLDVRVIMIGQNTFIKSSFSLSTSTASMDIELTGISNSTNASVAFISYNNMSGILKPRFFNTSINTQKNLISAVVSAKLLQADDTDFTSINFTFTHEFHLYGFLFCVSYPSCVHWEKTEWIKDGCIVTDRNSTHTVCSCDRQGTFAVIMQTYPVQMSTWKILITAALAVGMIILSLSALTLAFCHPNTRATNMPLINLCISLLLAMPYYLFTYHFWLHICPKKQLHVILNGIQLFLFLSAAMWMLIEAVHLFIFVKSLSKVRSNQGLSWKWLIVIGYLIPLVMATVYTVFGCTVNYVPKSVTFIYYVPFYFILTSNLILFIIIISILIFNLIRLKNGNLQRSNTNDKKLIISIMIKSIAQVFILCAPWIILYIRISDRMAYFVLLFFGSQQGTFIFLVHCLLNQEVRKQYKKFLCTFCCSNNCNTSTVDGQVAQETA